MISRRTLLKGGAALAAGVFGCRRERMAGGPRARTAVAILRAESYQVDLVERLIRGAELCGLEAKGKRVLLKPNLVEFAPGAAIHTEASVLAAAVELFRRLGAAEILIGEGPGHRRDSFFLAEEAKYRSQIAGFEEHFVDLNRDDVAPVSPFAGTDRLYLPRTALGVDLIVSVARMKTHHWAGATLSLKNLFGIVPGALYGWPKNHLHTLGIPQSVAELGRIFSRSFAIVDGIVGMEGNGPIQGKAKPCGTLVMGSDLAAVDATACRIMGIEPSQIEYLRLVRGVTREDCIEQRGESIESVQCPFELIPEFRHARLTIGR